MAGDGGLTVRDEGVYRKVCTAKRWRRRETVMGMVKEEEEMVEEEEMAREEDVDEDVVSPVLSFDCFFKYPFYILFH